MSPWLISLLVFAIIFGGALLGMVLRPLLSENHLQSDSRDVVKMATGLIGTLAALVLGLLIASANFTFSCNAAGVYSVVPVALCDAASPALVCGTPIAAADVAAWRSKYALISW